MFNRKTAIAATLIAVGAACAGTAQASDVRWSVGINLPQVATVISNVPVYHAPRPVYVPQPVVVYQPAPQVVYRPAPVYAPVPLYGPGYYGPGVVRTGWAVPYRYGHDHRYYRDRHDHGDRHDRWDDRRDDRRDGRGDRDDRRDNHHH